ncbi:TTN [Mytilus coruscus]|uniref:TTN n=1 Tax=Mytilus coruscus TaxID=42192 RepID=A0A6J8DMB2_MYTCO|nr:TTN [Mytilus coruscus]
MSRRLTTKHSAVLQMPGYCYADYIQSTNVYAYPETDAVLPCQLAINNTKQRWLKESSILTTGLGINKSFLSHKRLNIDVNYKEKKYNLLIANVRESDYGDYKCIIQNKQGVFTCKSKITLKRQDQFCKFFDNIVFHKDDHREVTTAADDKTEQTSTGFIRDHLYYMLLVVGLIVILSLSVGSNICINRNSKGKMSPHKNENQMHNNGINELVQEHDIDEEVIYEICSSEYESIDERQMIRNRCSDSVNHNSEASTNSKTEDQTFILQVGPYLDVIDDTCYQQQEKRVHGSIPSCHSTLINLSETQLQDYETIFPTDRTREAGILQFTRCTSNDTEDLTESFRILFGSRNSSFSSNSTHSSAGNNGTSTQQDDYLNPYMSLNTNAMDYLESYSAPTNQNRL